MRGERKSSPLVAAHIVNPSDGEVRYHLVPAGWAKVGIIILIFVALASLLLASMALSNRFDIEGLKRELTIHEQKVTNANTSNTNR